MNDNRMDKLETALNDHHALRDQNFVCPDAVLLYTEATGIVEEVELVELPLRFLLQGKGAQWCYEDLGKVIEAKALLYRQSMVAHEISEEYAEAEPPCGTVVLVQHADRHGLSWHRVSAKIKPE